VKRAAVRSLGHCSTAVLLALLPAFAGAQAGQDAPTAEEREMMMRMMRQSLEAVSKARQPPSASAASAADVGVPPRDAARIARVTRAPMSGAQLRAYVEALQPKIAQALSPAARQRAQAIEAALRAQPGRVAAHLAAAANGLAAWGAWPEATYLMGKAALASGSALDLNNLAAFLTMQKAGHAAAPILITLDARYPDNGTLLNNLGQAWFELGEVKEAERALTLAVRRVPDHPQANATRSAIEEARGDKAAAAESMRAAIRGGFSEAKAQRLARLGGSLRKDDLRWGLRMPADPLGLSKIGPPPYPRSTADLPAATAAWRTFLAQTATQSAELRQAFARQQTGRATERGAVLDGPGPLAAKARAVYAFDKEVLTRRIDALTREVQGAQSELQADWMATAQRISAVRSQCAAQQHPARDCGCASIKQTVDAFLGRWTGRLEPLQKEWLEWQRRKADADVYFAQYAEPLPLFENSKVLAKATYLSVLANLRSAGVLNAEVDYCRPEQPARHAGGKLADFDDLHCQHLVELVVPGFGSISVHCNRMDTKLDPIVLPFKASWTEDLNKDRVLRASAEIAIESVTVGGHGEFDDKGLKSGGVEAGAGVGRDVASGPFKAGVEASGKVGIEFDRSGITDIRIEGGVGSKATTTVASTPAASASSSVSTGVTSSWSWNAGASAAASGGFNAQLF
jgi:Tfp pilus assembly protein PilF